ncbi:MAG: carbon starvation protein A [Euryarchaeota archaeon]|nr:carbon starvation protein A [Euryarchaeota archaeon]
MPTGIIWIVAIILGLFTLGYVSYSKYLAGFVGLDSEAETPAHKYQDGQEYVPATKPVLLGHHYSSISGGAPIVGPITAAVAWGWVPAMLWVAIGNPLMGAVHDFMSLSSSIRHEGRSIGSIIGEYVGERGKNMFLWFAFLVIILVVAVFALLVGLVFDAYPQASTASIIYIALALVFGVYLYQLGLPFIPGTIAFVAGVFASVWIGIQYPLALFEPAAETAPAETIVLLSSAPAFLPGAAIYGPNVAGWTVAILAYAFIASILPVWVLLQPRDYLSSFLLYAGVGGALFAVVVGTILGSGSQPLVVADSIPAYSGFWSPALGPLFPILFITIACGTISGFHSLVSSGTTAKQLNKESDARLIGYGGMLAEGLLAAVALCTIAVVGFTAEGGGIGLALPNFAEGGGIILSALGIPAAFGAPFMALVLVSFLLTSTDTATRLGRYMMEEIIDTPETQVQEVAANKFVNTSVIVVIAFVLVTSGSWEDLWPLFGGANQLLAALALLAATVWLVNWDDSKQLITTGVPMAIMTVITILGLFYLAIVENLVLVVGALFGTENVFVAAMTGAIPVEFELMTMAELGVLGLISALLRITLAFVLIWLALSIVRMGYENIRAARAGGGQTVAADGSGDD